MNRLLTAKTTATSGAACWGQSYVYDRYANLSKINIPTGYGPGAGNCDNGPALDLTINDTNTKITDANFSYDAAGNLTASPVGYSYAFSSSGNAEGGNDIGMSFPATAHGAPEQAVAGGVTYTYTYNGPSSSEAQRVKKAAASSASFDKLYWYGLADNGGSQVLAESALDGTLTSEYIFLGDCVQPCARLPLVAARNPMARIARRDVASGGGGGNVYYFLGDRLGNARVVTNSTGGIVEESDFLPYGTERVIFNDTNQPDNNYKFTSHERDAETVLDHTLYRKNSSTVGRWLSVDAHRGNLADPQSLNRYPYVQNNPLNFYDPDGRLMAGVLYESPVFGTCYPGTYPTMPGSDMPTASSSCTISLGGGGSSVLDKAYRLFQPIYGNIIQDWEFPNSTGTKYNIVLDRDIFDLFVDSIYFRGIEQDILTWPLPGAGGGEGRLRLVFAWGLLVFL